jgi:nucleotidyltransferase substrate binding protein (TIGR01987 family)
MAQSEKLNNKIVQLKKAVSNFENTMKIDLFSSSDIIIDLVRNGQIQKFEYCTEMLWKTSKAFLEEKHGANPKSPKNAFRDLFENNYIDETTCEKLLLMVDDRNLLSHIYNENYFEEVHKHLPEHLELMKLVVEKIIE